MQTRCRNMFCVNWPQNFNNSEIPWSMQMRRRNKFCVSCPQNYNVVNYKMMQTNLNGNFKILTHSNNVYWEVLLKFWKSPQERAGCPVSVCRPAPPSVWRAGPSPAGGWRSPVWSAESPERCHYAEDRSSQWAPVPETRFGSTGSTGLYWEPAEKIDHTNF